MALALSAFHGEAHAFTQLSGPYYSRGFTLSCCQCWTSSYRLRPWITVSDELAGAGQRGGRGSYSCVIRGGRGALPGLRNTTKTTRPRRPA